MDSDGGDDADRGGEESAEESDDGEDAAGSTGDCVEELFVNVGFESWDDQSRPTPPPWQLFFGEAGHSSETDWGDNAIMMTAVPGDPDGGWELVQLAGAGPFFAGEVITISARARLVSGVGHPISIEVNSAGFPGATLPFVGSTAWEHVQADFELLEDDDTLEIMIRSYEPDQVVVLDEVHLTRPCG